MKKIKKIFSLLLSFALLLCTYATYSYAESKSITEIKILKEPDKTVFQEDEDWIYGMWDQSETDYSFYIVPSTLISFTHNPCSGRVPERGMIDMTGLVIEITYSDGTTEIMEYEETVNSKGYITSNIFFAPVGSFHTGTNSIYVYLQENVHCRAIYQIELCEKSYFRVKEGSAALIDKQGYVTGLKTDLTPAELASYFDYKNVEIKMSKASASSKYCGTGSTINVKYPDGTQEVYTVVIYGDIDGNGSVNSIDVSRVTKAVSRKVVLSAAQDKAARVCLGKRLTSSDANYISRVISSGKQINQVNPTAL